MMTTTKRKDFTQVAFDVVQRATVTAPAARKKQESKSATSSPALVARRQPKRTDR
jgi:hypothetical protein